MPTTYQQLIYSAVTNALRGMEPNASPNLDAEMIAESLFAEVAQAVSEAAAADEYRRSLLRRSKALALVAGSATLTDDVLTKFIADATLFDPAALSKHYTWRDYPDFVRRSDSRLGVFTLSDGVMLLVREPGQQFVVPLTATGVRTLVTPCVVVRPTLATDPVDAPDEIISDIIEALGDTLRGTLAKQAGENV